MSERNDMPGGGAKTPRRRRMLGLLLTVSLAVNLLVAGAVGTALWMHDGPGRGHKGHSGLGGPLTRALAPEDRRALGEALREARRGSGSSREDRAASYETILSALRAQPFDAEALGAAMNAHRQMFEADIATGQALLVGHLAKMSDDERADFADRVEEHRNSRKRDKGKPRD
ncbi:periplasmic heavy metal sensor [Roseovarius sp. C7]|uniref:periplasmic heavy metal sensor n=1 Tax=Roseovarius sp. C7 TaxID=3398643 RepID=UPI0039F6BAD5